MTVTPASRRFDKGAPHGRRPFDQAASLNMPTELLQRLPVPAPAMLPLNGRGAAARWQSGLVGLVGLLVAAAGLWFWMEHRAPFVQALSRLGPAPVAWALALACLSLGVRVLRWQWILRSMGHALPWRLQARAYLAGLALSSTPGKLGEASRALLLHAHGVPAAHTVGAFVCDRLADVVAVAALGVLAAWASGQRSVSLEWLLLASLVGGLALALAGQSQWGRRACHQVVQRRVGEHWRARLASAAAPLAAWARAWSSWRVLPWVLMAGLAYGIQAFVFFLFVNQVHAGVPWVRCVEIFSSSILIGAASLVPGGLGAMDAALVWQLQSASVPLEAAMVATLATRVCTLWFAWLVGLLAWSSFSRQAATRGQP